MVPDVSILCLLSWTPNSTFCSAISSGPAQGGCEGNTAARINESLSSAEHRASAWAETDPTGSTWPRISGPSVLWPGLQTTRACPNTSRFPVFQRTVVRTGHLQLCRGCLCPTRAEDRTCLPSSGQVQRTMTCLVSDTEGPCSKWGN